MSPEYVVRAARPEDLDTIVELIQELSDAQNVTERAQLTAQDLLRDGGFTSGSPQRFTCFVAVETASSLQHVVGYALCFFKTFTIKRRTLFVDSLHVRTGLQSGREIERALADALSAYARENSCFRIDTHVLSGGQLAAMWQQMGAEDLTATMGMHHLRLHSEAIDKLLGV